MEEDKYLNTNCRYYKNLLPEVDDLVMCKILETTETGVYTELIEYNNIKGFLATRDITKDKYAKVILKEGKEEILRVLKVDKKGYIDLSKKTVLKSDEFKEFYKKSKTVNGILKTMAQKLQTDVSCFYKEFCWDLYSYFDHAYDAFKCILTDPELVFSKININEEHKSLLIDLIGKKMKPNPVKIRANFELKCFSVEGINAIKFALLEGEKLSNSEFKIKLNYIASPLYEIVTETIKQTEGVLITNKVLRVVESAIRSKDGIFKLLNQPQVYGDHDKTNDLEEQIKKIKENNNEEDDEEEEDYDTDEGIKVNIEEGDKLCMQDQEAEISDNEDKIVNTVTTVNTFNNAKTTMIK